MIKFAVQVRCLPRWLGKKEGLCISPFTPRLLSLSLSLYGH